VDITALPALLAGLAFSLCNELRRLALLRSDDSYVGEARLYVLAAAVLARWSGILLVFRDCHDYREGLVAVFAGVFIGWHDRSSLIELEKWVRNKRLVTGEAVEKGDRSSP